MGAGAGIGFTVALFVTALPLGGNSKVDAATGGVLVASVLAALLGWALFSRLPVVEAEVADHSDDVRYSPESADVDPTDD